MTTLIPRTYSFSAVYLANAPATGSGGDVLVGIPNFRTDGIVISDQTPTERIPWLDLNVVTGLREIRVEMQFYTDTSNSKVELMTKGISLSGTFDEATDLQDYSLLLVAPDESTSESFYFPKLKSEIRYQSAFKKDNAIVIPVVLTMTSEDMDEVIYYRGTLASLITTMGARSPL